MDWDMKIGGGRTDCKACGRSYNPTVYIVCPACDGKGQEEIDRRFKVQMERYEKIAEEQRHPKIELDIIQNDMDENLVRITSDDQRVLLTKDTWGQLKAFAEENGWEEEKDV